MAVAGLYDFRWCSDDDRLRGQAVHHACRLVNRGVYAEQGTHPKLIPYVRAYQKFVKATGYRSLGGEVPMGNTRLGFAGTPDDWGMVGPETWVIDTKSGSLPPMVGVQLAAYKALLECPHDGSELRKEQRGIISSCVCVQLGVDEEFHVQRFDEREWAVAWQSALNLFNLKSRHGLLPKERNG